MTSLTLGIETSCDDTGVALLKSESHGDAWKSESRGDAWDSESRGDALGKRTIA